MKREIERKYKLLKKYETPNFTINEGNVFFKTEELARKALEILGEETIIKALTLNH